MAIERTRSLTSCIRWAAVTACGELRVLESRPRFPRADPWCQVVAGVGQFGKHFLYFLPLPHGHGSLRPTRGASRRIG